MKEGGKGEELKKGMRKIKEEIEEGELQTKKERKKQEKENGMKEN